MAGHAPHGRSTAPARARLGRPYWARHVRVARLPLAARAADDSDEDLMLAYARGPRPRAFDALYARHKGGVYRYLLRHCGNAGIADELFQDVWMNAIRVRATLRADREVHDVALHARAQPARRSLARERAGEVRVDRRRRRRRRATRVESLPGARHDEPEHARASRRARRALHAALAALPAAQRDAFLLQHEGGLSLAEIAALTGVGVETVKSRLRYAMAKLRSDWTAARGLA